MTNRTQLEQALATQHSDALREQARRLRVQAMPVSANGSALLFRAQSLEQQARTIERGIAA